MAHGQGFLKPSRGTGEIDPHAVARMAYELYEQRGHVDGHDLDDWLKAEESVRRQGSRGNGQRTSRTRR